MAKSLEKKTRIHELEVLIKKYQDAYYNGDELVSDAEFDALWDELKTLDAKNALLKKIGKDATSNFEKVQHLMPMGSQEKAGNPEEFFSWAKKHSYDEYLVEYKLDGASLELQYEHGKFLKAVTRGDGKIGDDISANAKKMQGLVFELKDKNGKNIDFSGGIRGEVLMSHEIYEKKYSDKANCRNAANGLMKRKDGSGSEDLSLVVYDAWESVNENFFTDEVQKLAWLSDCGFSVVKMVLCKTADEVVSYRSRVMEERKNLPFDIDGLVVKEKKIDRQDASRARPEKQIAFKFSLEEAVSILREVEWSMNGGTYTPVAIFDAVELAGTTVRRASLANPDTVRSLGVKIGSSVVVVKRGEIIPKIESVVQNENETHEIIFPEKCETCGTTLVDEGSRLFCPNKNCSKRVLHQLLKWIETADIRDFGETLLRDLFLAKKVLSISDIYKLDTETLAPFFLDEKSLANEKKSLGAEKVIASIFSHRDLSLSRFIAGFDIEGIGELNAEKLVSAGFDTIEKLLSASETDFANVYGFAEKMAHIAVEGLKENADEMRALLSSGTIRLTKKGSALFGKSFCFTGELYSMKRKDAENLVKANGGECKSSVTKGLSFLVTNDTESGSAKNVKARSLGIAIIDENEFLKMLGTEK